VNRRNFLATMAIAGPAVLAGRKREPEPNGGTQGVITGVDNWPAAPTHICRAGTPYRIRRDIQNSGWMELRKLVEGQHHAGSKVVWMCPVFVKFDRLQEITIDIPEEVGLYYLVDGTQQDGVIYWERVHVVTTEWYDTSFGVEVV